MRITAEAKHETRRRILDAAQELFRAGGYEVTTTRKIAERAGIGLATLFNYFPTKEAIVANLASTALEAAREEFERAPAKRDSLAEDLFAFVACELRHLKPYRTFLTPLLETTLSPLANSRDQAGGDALRTSHLGTVRRLSTERGASGAQTPVALQLYWTLYTGVLAHWATDESPRQEDTLALLDDSLAMFAGWVERNAHRPKDRSR
jgi:AcrR family transcriptional regulator